jgi:hypothetical protein
MARYVIEAPTLLHLVGSNLCVNPTHQQDHRLPQTQDGSDTPVLLRHHGRLRLITAPQFGPVDA